MSQPAPQVLQNASTFWVELVRVPEGGSQNQAELFYNGHFFFYKHTSAPSQSNHHPLTFEDVGGNSYTDPGRRIVFNGPPLRTKGNSMWRVYLPTAKMGFTGYQSGNAVVRFSRTPTADHYLVEVAPLGSPQALAWAKASAGTVQFPGPPARSMGWS